MNARRALLVARREYVESIRTKGFWIGIFVLPVILALSIVVPIIGQALTKPRAYAVLDQSGWLDAAIRDQARGEDLRRLLKALRREAKNPAALAEMPAPVRDLAAIVLEMDEARLDAVAAAVAGAPVPGQEPLAPELKARIALVQGQVMAWYASLGSEEAKSLGARLTRDRYARVEIPVVDDPEAWMREQLGRKPAEGGLFAYFVIGSDPIAGSDGCKYVANNQTDTDLREWFTRLASEVVTKRRFETEGVTAAAAERINAPLRFSELQVSAGEEMVVSAGDKARQWAPMVFVYLLWITTFSTASALLTNTVEEKSNRLMEVLLSSVSPFELMAGKILGTACTGLTLVGTWVLFFLGSVLGGRALMGPSPVFDVLFRAATPEYLAGFVVYYLLGFLFYATILVAIGSICDSLQDAQNFMAPVTMILIVPLMTMVPISRDPNGLLAQVLSWLPPFTPLVMMSRAAGPPAVWEYIGTGILLAVSVVVAVWMAAKVFRVGILMSGKPPRPAELLRWLRAPVGSPPVRRD